MICLLLLIDRQKIAKKLCSGITKETRIAKGLWQRYCEAGGEASAEEKPSLQEILSLKSAF